MVKSHCLNALCQISKGIPGRSPCFSGSAVIYGSVQENQTICHRKSAESSHQSAVSVIFGKARDSEKARDDSSGTHQHPLGDGARLLHCVCVIVEYEKQREGEAILGEHGWKPQQ